MQEYSKKILIIDDSRIMRTQLRIILEDEGYEVVGEADEGTIGIELASILKPDLVTLDIVLPDMSGLTVLKKLKEKNPETPVIVLTSLAQIQVREEALDLGAIGMFVKPFDEADVKKQLKKIFGNRKN